MPTDLADLLAENDDTVAEGWVESVRDAYDHCRVFVAPLRSGAGIKGKVIGALGYGVPTVMSPLAAEGIGIHDGVDGFVADTPAEWVAAIAKIYKAPKVWNAVSSGARELAQQQFGFQHAVAEMREALQAADIFTHEQNTALVAR
jgi:glycosyltransferase involved in cell wall biosynthesis